MSRRNALGLVALAAFVAALIPAAVAAQPQSTTLAFETEGLDLETGTVITLGDPAADDAAVDFHIAANADRATMAVVFQAPGAEIALLGTRPSSSSTR